MSWKHQAILTSLLTVIVGFVCLALHLAVIDNPNEGWPLAVLIRNTVGIWWVVLAMAAVAFQQSFIAWMVFRAKRKPRECEPLK